ncbi:arylsulfatase [Sphingomonas sp. KC8]|uniref:arylsulfatase n=1 Tax=Sphingomonas sp. KC8 TaxID=1030157 RepID=UPI0002489793|nr:arylsulfatase [Sphingomonas sp. KC8]ARS26582.1 arylsulfatase [Sphingomonas sp. KC8]
MKNLLNIMLAATALTGVSTAVATSPAMAAPAAGRPNIIVVIVDDMGFSDIGAFGSEIRTPNLDALATGGVRFNNFHTTPVCSPTRAELLTGVDHHQTGIGTFPELLQDNQAGKPGYEGYLNNRVVTIAERLRDAGYKTIQSGKWHLGYDPAANPAARGFERSFAMLGGGHNHFGRDAERSRPDMPNVGIVYTLDGKQVGIPDNFYSSDYFSDRLMEFLPAKGDRRPFFGYLALTAPHYPLHAPPEDIKRYAGKYDAGYDVLRTQRLAKLKALNLIPADVEPHSQTSTVRWYSLSDDEKRIEARKMEVYAAMVDRVDQNIGRLIAELKKRGVYDNTVIMFLSDNGPEGHELDKSFIIPEAGKAMLANADNRLESIGTEQSYIWYGPNWAEAASAPFRKSKSFPTEGGTRVTAFMSYPRQLKGRIDTAYTSVRDVVPTLLQYAAIDTDLTHFNGRDVLAPQGASFAARIAPGARTEVLPPLFAAGEMFGRRYVRKGNWKAVHIPPPTGSGRWELFDMDKDPGEVHDLGRDHRDVLADLVRSWNIYAAEKGVVPPIIPGN